MQKFVSSEEFLCEPRWSRLCNTLTAGFKAPPIDNPLVKAQKMNSSGY